MRQLLPSYDDVVDLVAAYRYPPRPLWVRANMVASVDGAAIKDGSSRPLSGAGDKQVFGVLRGLCDAVLVGAGTASAENYRGPRARPAFAEHRAREGQRAAPVLALVSRSLDLDRGSSLFQGDERTLVITVEQADERARAELATVADVVVAGRNEVDVAAAMTELESRGLRRVLCEGGPTLLSAVAAAGCLDELCLTVSPVLVGGDAPRVVDGLRLDRGLDLRHVLEHDGVLFTRYAVG